MPSADVGAEVRRKRALNCWPWVRSLTHWPEAMIHSPAEMAAAWPTTATRSRWPRALTRRTQNILSVVVGYSLHETCQDFSGSGCGFMRTIAFRDSPWRPACLSVFGADAEGKLFVVPLV
jgi:hypothetical protein